MKYTAQASSTTVGHRPAAATWPGLRRRAVTLAAIAPPSSAAAGSRSSTRAMMMIIHAARAYPSWPFPVMVLPWRKNRIWIVTRFELPPVERVRGGVGAEGVGEQQQDPTEDRRRQDRDADATPVAPRGGTEVGRRLPPRRLEARRWPGR